MNEPLTQLAAMTRRRFLATTAAAGTAAMLGSCAKRATVPERSVVLYTSADDVVAAQIVSAFEAATGIGVLLSGDTEATKTTGLVQRLRAEQGTPRADVFWSSEIFQTIKLAREGLFAAHHGVEADARDEIWKDADGQWHAFGKRARVIVYNTDTVPRESAPETFRELANRKYRGRVVMADPRFGTTRGHMGALMHLWGQRIVEALFTGMFGNDLRLVDGNASVVQAVAYGEAQVGITDTDDVWAGQRNRWPIDLTYLRHDAGSEGSGPRRGSLVIPNTVARIAGGPNPEEASKLIEFLLSAQTERLLAESGSHHNPVRDDVPEPEEKYIIEDPMSVDYEAIADVTDAGVDIAMRMLRG